jgi:tyrosine-specific transport protein
MVSFKFLKALAVFTGTIIGVGIFSLPYIASKAGFFVVLGYFVLMTVVVIFVHLFYGEVVAGTKESNYLPGHAAKYLGERWKIITLLVIGLGTLGALLVYLIVGGEFLNLFLSPSIGGNSTLWGLVFFAFGAFLIFRGIRSFAAFELVLLSVFFIILIAFFVKAVPIIDFKNFTSINLSFLTFPYGVILFSLWGATFIPELKQMLSSDLKLFKRVIISGTIFSALTYLFFIITILGASGESTSKEAIEGFMKSTGGNIVKAGLIFGIVNIFDSFVAIGLILKKILWHDFGLSKNMSWFIACFLPLVLFFIGPKEYISIIGLIGTVLIGTEGMIIVFIYRNFLKSIGKKINPLIYSLCGIFLLGIIFEAFYFFAKSI